MKKYVLALDQGTTSSRAILFDKNGNIYNNQDDLLRRLYVACSRASKELILCYGR